MSATSGRDLLEPELLCPLTPFQFPGRRVLVVDDSVVNRLLLAAMLRVHGCEADVAPDGAVAVEAVLRNPYDLILMDVHMPVMDGRAATRAIRAAGRGEVPILGISASRSADEVGLCAEAGMDGQLSKPFSSDDLATALATVFGAAGPRRAMGELPTSALEDAADEEQRRFEESMGMQTAEALVGMFQQQLQARFLVETPDVMTADAHQTAGSAGLLGLHALASAAARLEVACVEGRNCAVALWEVRQLAFEGQATLAAWRRRLAADRVLSGKR